MALSKLLGENGPAAPSSFVSTIQLLLARGACPRDVDGEGFEPLHRLLTNLKLASDAEVGLALIGDFVKAGADPNAPLKAADPAALLSPVDRKVKEEGDGLGRTWGQEAKGAATASAPAPPAVSAHGRPADEVCGPLHLACGIGPCFAWASENVRNRGSGAGEVGTVPVAGKAAVDEKIPASAETAAIVPRFPSATLASALLTSGRKMVSEAVIGALLAQGTQPNARTIPTGETALHLLLRLFSSLKNMTATPSIDAAMVADQMQQIQGSIRRLLAAGARTDIGDQTGMTVVQLADSLGLRGLLPSGGDAATGGSGSGASAGSPRGGIPPNAAQYVPGLCRTFKRFLLHEPSTLGPRNRLEALSATFPSRVGYVVEPHRWHGNNLPAGGSAASVDYGAGNSCLICDSPFTMLKRKHHCRSCAVLVCQNCSNKKFPLFKPPASSRGADSDDDDAAASFGLRRMGLSTSAAGGAGPDVTVNVVEERVCDGCFNRLCTAVATCAKSAELWEKEKEKAAAMGIGRNLGAVGPQAGPTSLAYGGGSGSVPAGADAQRDALFAGRSAAAGADASDSSSSSRMGGTSATTSEIKEIMNQNKLRLAERGEKLGRLDEKTRKMADSAQGFAEVAEKLKRQSQPSNQVSKALSSWFGL
jgi:FYVE zinc finger/Synaptobrevin